jgi:hypothetical protein
MKGTIFWNVTTCSPIEVQQCFEGTAKLACYLLLAGYFLGLFFNSEDKLSILLRNVDKVLLNYMPLHLRGFLVIQICSALLDMEHAGRYNVPYKNSRRSRYPSGLRIELNSLARTLAGHSGRAV